jgi:nucleoside-diphosphate-sugar epimerase
MSMTIRQAAGQVYNICDEPVLSELEWQEEIAIQAKWPRKFVVLPRERTPEYLLQPGNTAQHVVVSSDKIRAELGYKEPVDPHEALRRTIAWEQSHPPARVDL